MGCQRGDAAPLAMPGQRPFETPATGDVQPDARLVEQPERALDRQEPGQGEAALLSGRKIAGANVGQSQEVEPLEPAVDPARRCACKRAWRRSDSRAR